MKASFAVALAVGLFGSCASVGFVVSQVRAAGIRLADPTKREETKPIAVADHTEAPYCTPQFKTVLQRVLNACGLIGQESRRGCQPADVKTLASISDEDFVALFAPLENRGGIVMFDDGSEKLDEGAKKLILEKWEDRRGARYFFIVARASKTGAPDTNRILSHKRANSVLFLLQEHTKDPDLEKKVGQLWLGSEYAQLPKEYCEKWDNSRKGKPCNTEAINRSAFVSWVDCRL